MREYPHGSSERGMALIVVLLMMAVLSGLATGFSLTGQIESEMGRNEVYFAGARAAAEAGLNRALAEVLSTANNGTNFFDPGNLDDALGGAGPFPIGATGEYSFTVQVFDDDDNTLYVSALSPEQLALMGETDADPAVDQNSRFVLRATGFGPEGTTVRLARIIENEMAQESPTSTSAPLSTRAMLVNGNLSIIGLANVQGSSGKVHVNGNLTVAGFSHFSGDVTATGSLSSFLFADYDGAHTGGAQAVNVPNVNAADYQHLADYKLAVVGGVGQVQERDGNGNWVACYSAACSASQFTYSGGTWSLIGQNNLSAGTYYAEGAVSILGLHTGPSNSNLPFSLIATGSITIGGGQKFTPENTQKLQFVTDQDFVLLGVQDLDAINDSTTVEGLIMAREQMSIVGIMEFQGRIVVQNAASASNTATSNSIIGVANLTYNGTLGALDVVNSPGAITYTTNISGWLEQQ